MKTYSVTLPEIGIVAATRGMAGVGAGLLLGKLLAGNRRGANLNAVGWTLLAIGAVSTIPILMALLGKREPRQGQLPLTSREDRDDDFVYEPTAAEAANEPVRQKGATKS